MPKLTKSQSGAVSMLTVIFLAVLLTVITTSFVRLSVTEQRQSIDDDLTTRAFYAAESGVEDAKRAIAQYQDGTLSLIDLNGDDCQPAQGLSGDIDLANLDTEYTCQLIDLSPANFQAELAAWESITVPLRATGNFNAVRIDWHVFGSGDPYDRRADSDQSLPTVNDWLNSDYPAMLRGAVFSHPSAANFSAPQVTQGVLFINPAQSAQAADASTNDGQIRNGACAAAPASGQYACTITVTGVNDSREFYIRLQSLYRSTNVQVTLLNSGSVVEMDEVQAVVDVTGRSNDVFRRVEARVSLAEEEFPLPDIALWSNTEICKNFTITDAAADYSNTCPWAP